MKKIKNKSKYKKRINKTKENNLIEKNSMYIKDYFVAGCNVNYS